MPSSSGMLRRPTPSPPAPLRSDVTKQQPQQQRGAAEGPTVAAAATVTPLHWPATLPPYHSPSPSTSSASPLLPATPGAPAGSATGAAHLCSSCCHGSCASSSGSWPSSSPLFAAALYAIALGLATFGNEWSTRIGRDLVRSEAVAGGTARAPAVYDLGRSVLPALDSMVWLPDLLLLPMFLVAAIMIRHKATALAPSAKHTAVSAAASRPTPSGSDSGSGSSFARRVSLLVCMHAYVLLLRTVSVCVTILGASPRCQHQSLLLHASNAGFVLNSGCFDLMFSGHSSFAALIGAAALWSGAIARPAKVVVVLLALLAALANVLVGDHYSADVWLGVYVGASIAAMHRHDIRAAFA